MKKFISNPNGVFNTVQDACSELNLSRSALMKFASDSESILRIGRTIRINMPKLREFLDSRCGT